MQPSAWASVRITFTATLTNTDLLAAADESCFFPAWESMSTSGSQGDNLLASISSNGYHYRNGKGNQATDLLALRVQMVSQNSRTPGAMRKS
jgi:hypothetical protein